MKLLFLTLLLISTLNNCTTTKPPVRLGIDVLSSNNFEQLRGKRIGLITNQTGVNSNLTSTIDILSSNRAKYYGVSLVALFAPEHGVRGDIEAGLRVKNNIDAKSGVELPPLPYVVLTTSFCLNIPNLKIVRMLELILEVNTPNKLTISH